MFPFLSEFEGRFAQTSVLALDLSGFTGVELQRPLSTEGLRLRSPAESSQSCVAETSVDGGVTTAWLGEVGLF